VTNGVARDATSEGIVHTLAAGGCVDPEGEAGLMLVAAGEGVGGIDELVARRLGGEPLAWISGFVWFGGVRVLVDPGVFVPRPHTEALARRAVELLPDDGVAVDLCTGSGAVAAVLHSARPNALVLATDLDPVAVACARRNGIDALLGDLDEPIPSEVRGRVDVVTVVAPYVPSEELHLLPRDVLEHEPRRALDGGNGGTAILLRATEAAGRLLRPGGRILLELGGDQAHRIARALSDHGLAVARLLRDEDGRDRAVEARRV
jgi:release factor glutamine methyltransferase